MSYIQTITGRTVFENDGTPNEEYFVKDKLGDISGTASGFVPNRHRYQGNEYEKDLGLDWMDFQARQYDPQIGRFLGVDPLADGGGQEQFSPYAAMGDNPGIMVDPGGMRYTDRQINWVWPDFRLPDVPDGPSGGYYIWLPSMGGAVDYGHGMTEGMKSYAAYLDQMQQGQDKIINGNDNRTASYSISDMSQQIKNDHAEYKSSDGYGNSSYYDPVVGATLLSRDVIPSIPSSGYDWGRSLSQLGNIGIGRNGGGGNFWSTLGYIGMGFDIAGGGAEAYGWRITGKFLGATGTMVGAVKLVKEGIDVKNDQMGLGRFSYHLVGFGTSVAVGAEFGGPYGAATGAAFWGGEQVYDNVIDPYIMQPASMEFNGQFNSFIHGYFNF